MTEDITNSETNPEGEGAHRAEGDTQAESTGAEPEGAPDSESASEGMTAGSGSEDSASLGSGDGIDGQPADSDGGDSEEGTEVLASGTESEESGGEEAGTTEGEEAPTLEGASAEEAEPTNPYFKWYVVHTYSMFEEKARQALLERIKQNKMEDYFGDVMVPKTATERLLKSGKKKRVETTSFPGYIIVQMQMTEETNHLVRDTPKITGFVGNARKPRPITDREAMRLTAPEQVQEEKAQAASTLTFDQGETVKVIDGAFTNFDGIVDQVQADKMKLRILVSIFGRETPVELDYSQVQKLS